MDEHLPRHLVLKHIPEDRAKDLGGSFDALFHWGNDDSRAHVLYDDGRWIAPEWVNDSKANLIRKRNYRESDRRVPLDQPIDELPTIPWTRGTPDLNKEGLDAARLTDQFESTTIEETTRGTATTSDGGQTSTTPHEDRTEASTGDSEHLRVDNEFQSDVLDQLEELEDRLDEIPSEQVTPETVDSRFEAVENQLEDIEATLGKLPQDITAAIGHSVSATVLRQDGLLLLRLNQEDIEDSERDLAHGQEVTLLIEETD